MWFAYSLRSKKDGWLYVGLSSDVQERLKEHNAGYNRSTKSRRPFELIYVEGCGSRGEARNREKYLKSGVGRQFLKTLGALESGREVDSGKDSATRGLL